MPRIQRTRVRPPRRALQEAEAQLEATMERCEADDGAIGELRGRLEEATRALQVHLAVDMLLQLSDV